ncbi:mitochondrial nuclease [Russula compacta]|nr:mitochondrial nuclease [Russula compacta]
MPTSSVIRVAFFALGAAVGGGAVVALNASKKKEAATVPSPTADPTSSAGPSTTRPIVELGATGDPRFSQVVGAGYPVLRYGNPGPISDQLVRRAYVAGYDRRMRHPAWTAEHLTLASLGKSALASTAAGNGDETGDRGRSTFQEDESLPAPFRAKLQDYFRSGYDRGHMVPAADAKRSQAAMDETFLLSNIAPQVGAGFNRHYWAYLEDWCRRLTSSFTDVYVFTIPLYLPQKDTKDGKWRVTYEVIGNPPNVAVPTHFAKVVLTSRPSSPSSPHIPETSTGAFVLPNAIISDETPLESFVVPVDAVERAAGLTLFSDAIKGGSKHICRTTKCEVIMRHFDDTQKRPEMRRAISSPR